MNRSSKPGAISLSPGVPQPVVDLTDNIVTARLQGGDSVQVYLYGATVTSWKTSNNKEQLFLSSAAALDGSKPIRGGIPLVFPVFGPPPKDHATGALPQHGFARNNHWEFLGKTTSEGMSRESESVKLDFGLSTGMLDAETKKKWPYEFGLVYSVTLSKDKLEIQLHVQNKDTKAFDFQCLFHTYFNVPDITKTTVSGLEGASYVDKVKNAATFTEKSSGVTITSETDRVYTTPSMPPIAVNSNGKPHLVVTRDSLPDCTVWNGWQDKLKAMGDFEPKDGWKRYLCIEPGTVSTWTKLEGGDAWEGSTIMEAKL